MLLGRVRWGTTLSAPPKWRVVRQYHWVYKNGEHGYDDKRIEEKFTSLSKGGSINLDDRGEISIITICNPTKRNSFTGTMMVELRKVVEKLWSCEKSKAVVLCGKDASFCSGLDLNLASKMTSVQDGIDMCMYMQNTLTAFQLLPIITVAAVKGPAVGGGAEVATAADFRLMYAGAGSKIQFVQKKMGITPGWGGTTRLQQIVGQRKAMHLLASSEVVDSKSALLIGLADALVSDSGDIPAEQGALEWLHRSFNLGGTDRSVFVAIKESALGLSYDSEGCLPLDYKLRREKDILANVWGKTPNLNALNGVISNR